LENWKKALKEKAARKEAAEKEGAKAIEAAYKKIEDDKEAKAKARA
jgi:hypothetical protein